MGVPKFEKQSTILKGIGDSTVTAFGRCEVEFKIDNVKFMTTILVVPKEAIPIKLIIGKPVIRNNVTY